MKKAFNFAEITEGRYSNFKDSKAVILPVPYEAASARGQGTRLAPEAIIKASARMERFDEELHKETYKIGIHTHRPLRARRLSPKKMTKRVERAVRDIILKDKLPVIIGGEHSISVGAIRGVARVIGKFSLLQLDAHCDLRNEYLRSRYNRACFARRVLELAPMVQVGVRSLSKEENDFLPHPKIRIVSAYDIQNSEDWAKKACETLSDKVYVTIDSDVFDPGVVPSAEKPEPGGMGWYEVIGLLSMVAKKSRVIGFDVMGHCPVKGSEAADFLMAKLIYRFLGYIFEKRG